MENPIKMDDLGVPLFLETSIFTWWFRILICGSFHCGSGSKDAQNLDTKNLMVGPGLLKIDDQIHPADATLRVSEATIFFVLLVWDSMQSIPTFPTKICWELIYSHELHEPSPV